nr:hypothetical protein [uncultured Lichenicoccus sp.]
MIVDLSLGLDSFAACLGAGLLPADRRIGPSLRVLPALPALFGCCDAGATLLSGVIAHRALLLPQSATYLACAVLLGFAACRSRRVLYALPVLLGLDDLLAPVVRDPFGAALMQGAASFAMATAGGAAAVLLRRLQDRLRPARGAAG